MSKVKDYRMLAFILSGHVRMKIVSFLMKKPGYAYEIAQSEGLHISSVLRSLKNLEENNIIKCINPNSSRRKFYKITSPARKLEKDILERINRKM